MAQTYRSRHLGIMRDQERALDRLFGTLSETLGREVMRWADATGIIPRESTYALQQRVAQQVMSMFLTERGGRMVAYTLAANGAVQPLSPYMRILWGSIEAATAVPVEQQAAMMRRYLPQDLIVRLALANREGVVPPVREQGPAFRPNPLARYDAPHLWVDPNGYRLSDRIWSTASNTRRRVDMFLEEGIAQGRSARDIAADLEQFLQPGRQLKRTTAPYGTDASYDAMRLARTEVSRAAASASQASAAMNPFVAGLKWNLSPQHPCCDVCDTYAAGGPYPVDSPPTMPAHPHCLCYWTYELVDDPQEVVAALQEEVRSARRDLLAMVGPVQLARFVQMLLRGWSVSAPGGVLP